MGQSSHNLLLSTASAICMREIFIQLVKTSVRESLSDMRLHNENINKPAMCHLLFDCLFVYFFPNYILKYKLVIAYRVQNWQVPYHPSFHTNTSKLFLGKEQPHSKKEPVQQKPCPNCSSPLKNCQCALLVPPKGGGGAVRTGGEFCNCGHIHEAQLNFCEVHSCRSVKTCTVWMKSRSF